LFIGNSRDCFYENRKDWVVVHACKNPCHCFAVGYTGSLNKEHPNYLSLEQGNHLYLNIVDMPKPLSPIYTNPIIKSALDFIEKHINSKKVLIHCNLCESRVNPKNLYSPTLISSK